MNTFYIKSKLMTGDRALSNIPHELKMMCVSRPLLISERMDAYPPFYKPIKRAFDNDKLKIVRIIEYTSNTADVETINDIIESYKASEADSIIAVGREAVISVAKLVKLAIEQGVKDIRNIESIAVPEAEIPLVVVPIFYGSGDEAKGSARCYDDNVAYEFVSDTLMPHAVVVDNAMIFKTSKTAMATSMMYALSAAIMSYTAKSSNVMIRTAAMSAIELICKSINNPLFKKKPMLFANEIATSIVIAGIAHTEVKDDKLTRMTSIVSRAMKLPFSKVYSMLFPHYYEQIIDKDDISFMEVLLPIIGEERYSLTPINSRAEGVVENVRALLDYLHDSADFNYNLSDFGMRRDDIMPLVDKIEKAGVDGNIARITLERTL